MEYIRLDKYCNAVKDGTHDTPKPVEEGMPLVTSKAINNNRIDFSQTYNISQEDYQQINKRSLVQKWDILMTMIGSVGRLLLVQDEPRYAIKNIALFKIDDELKSRWLYYYLSQRTIQDYFQAIANGTSQHFVPLKDLRRFKVASINDNSQRIVSILSAYDSQIENNQKRIKLLEQMAENLYKEWFVRFRFPGYETAEFEGGVPKGWKVVKVKECVDRLRFGTLYGKDSVESDGDVIVIDQSQEPYIGFHNNAPSHIADTQKPIILFGDHSCKFELMIIPFSLAENVVPFVAKSGIDTTFLYFTTHNLIQTTEYKRHWTEFVNKKILLPPANLQREYAKKVIDILSMKQQLIVENRLLSKQRDLLLPRLMSGKLSI